MTVRETRILIVDDAKFSSAVVERALKAAGYRDIRHATSAQSALQQLEEKSADILIADWLMPEMDGLALTRRVRQLEESSNRYTYILLLTAKEGVGALKTAFDEGVDDFVNKSAMNEQLVPRVMAGERLTRLHNRMLVENQRLIELNARLRKSSTLDALTGYGNRSYAMKRLDDAMRQARQRGGAASLLLIRIANYAETEARAGRQLTQQLVLAFSRRLRQMVRPMDTLARLSPQDFCLITHQSDQQYCTPASFRRIHEGLNHHAYKTSGGFMQLSVASLVGFVDQHQEVASEVLLRAMEQQLSEVPDNNRVLEYRA